LRLKIIIFYSGPQLSYSVHFLLPTGTLSRRNYIWGIGWER